MRGMPFNLQGKGVLEVAAATEALWRSTTGNTNSSGSIIGKKEGVEPRSVLDHRRSPSPPTSTSTLSSSLGGGSTDSAGVAAVSDNPPHKWPPSQDTTSSAAAEETVGGGGSSGSGGGRKVEWVSELQPIPPELEIGVTGGEKCGLGMEDWESMLSEPPPPPPASPGHDQSFLRWIMGDVDDPSSVAGPKQPQQHPHHQLLSQIPVEFVGGGGGAGGFGLIDPVFGFGPIGGIDGGVSSSTPGPLLACSSTISSGGGFPLMNSGNGNSSNSNRILPFPPSPGPLPSLKVPCFGDNPNPNPNLNPNPIFSPPTNSLPLPLSLPPGLFLQEPTMEEKPQLFSPNFLLNQQQVHTPQNPAFFLPLSPYAQPDHQQQHLLPPQPKQHLALVDPSCQISPKVPFSDSGQDLFLRRHHQPQQQQQQEQSFGNLHVLPYQNLQQRPMKVVGDEAVAAAAAHHQQQQALVDQLYKAAELIQAGNSVNARGILARLNHQLSPVGKPLLRSAFYFKEALQYIVTNNPSNTPPSTSPPPLRNPSSTALSSPLDVVLKLSAYKAFTEISPLLQFTNFTCIQALLEKLNGCDHIHIVDFDIGVGGQWSSFIQELAQRRAAMAAPLSLKITAFTSPSFHHPLELGLTRENLSHFAGDLNIPFEFNVLSIDPFNPAGLLNMSLGSDEAIAVNLPVGSAYPSIPTLLRLVKQLSPKIVVSVDHGCDRSDLSFSHHFLHALQASTVLLDSIDAAGTNPDVASKIERFLLQPRIESAVLGRHRNGDKMLPWRTMFASTGFIPLSFSNFTETQAECLLKRTQFRGFHVEKRQTSLFLCWQHGDLVSVSAWRC